MTSRLLPLFVSLEGATVVVTGDGPSASDVAARMSALGASVRAVAGPPSDADLDGALLLVAAAGEPAADAAAIAAASRRGLLAASALEGAGRAFLGACEQKDGIVVAATTLGRSPELEARLASACLPAIEPQHDRFAAILAGIRGKLEDRIPDPVIRASIWEQILDSPVMLLLQAGNDDEAVEMAERMAWGTG